MTDKPGTKAQWRYSINYGPDVEENWANLYDDCGNFVGNFRTHHAKAIVAATSPIPAIDMDGDTLLIRLSDEQPSSTKSGVTSVSISHQFACERADTLAADAARMREALKPFALYARFLDNSWKDTDDHWQPAANFGLTVGDLRRARAALNQETPDAK